MAIQTEDMTAFLAVAREGSFGRAATALLVSQPAVSERMARLEREVGATLFVRGARGTTLSAAGQQFLPYATRVIDLLAEGADSVRRETGAPRLRVAVHVTFAHRAVPLVLAALDTERRSITLRDAHTEEIIAMLLDGVADVGFVVPSARPPSLRFEPLSPDPVIALCARRHPLARRRVTLADLAQSEHRVAFNRWGVGAAETIDRLTAAGLQEWRCTECSDALTALDLVRRHAHIGFVPASVAAERLAAGEVTRLDVRSAPAWHMPLVLATRVADRNDRSINAIRDAVRDLRRSHSSR